MLVELSVVEQRYHAVMEVLAAGAPVTEVAARYGVSRQSVHAWVRRYQADGLAGLADRSHRPHAASGADAGGGGGGDLRAAAGASAVGSAPAAATSSAATGVRGRCRRGRRSTGCWSATAWSSRKRRRRRREDYRRWERPGPMQLWQLDVDGRRSSWPTGAECKLVTGVDDHSRFCVIATVVRAGHRPGGLRGVRGGAGRATGCPRRC